MLFMHKALEDMRDKKFKGAKVINSSSANVGFYAAKKAKELGVVARSDIYGYIYDKNGVDIYSIIIMKEMERKTLN